MAFYISCMLILVAMIFSAANAFHASPVPVLLWSPERSMSQLPEVTGVDPIKTDDFLHGYLSPLMKSTAEISLVFLQDELHTDDFTKYADVYSLDSDGGAFKNVKSLMTDHFSLELPQVANPSDAVDKLKSSFSGSVHTVKSAAEFEALNLDKDERILIIVQLNPVRGQKDRENAIQKNDATIGAITQHLQKRNAKYSALFTGHSASDGQAENVNSRQSRHLLATTNAVNGTFLNVSDGQIYIFIRKAHLVLQIDGANGKTIPMNLTIDNDIANNSTHNNLSAEIRFDFKNIPVNNTEYNVSIVTDAKRYSDRWTMSLSLYVNGGIEPESNVSLENATFSPGDNDFTIPIIYSWHCTEMKLFLDTVKYANNSRFAGSYLLLDGYQVQPFNIQRSRFFDAQDCVPYFTTAIWMFLFSAIFLLSILIFGVLMVLSLSTMDKYDDPKGKTITIAQGTE